MKELLAIFALIFFFASFSLGVDLADLKKEAIERGYAHYCPNSGEWAWKGDCDE